MYQNSDILSIKQNWVLRNDHDYLLLYLRSTNESRNWILNPIQAYIISLIDGDTEYKDLIYQVSTIFKVDEKKAKKIIDDHIKIFNSVDDIICRLNGYSINKIKTSDYFIDIEKYNIPQNNRLRIPTKIGLFVSPKCMADCIYCYADRRIDHNKKELSYQEWVKIIDMCIDEKIYNLDILGGDPLADVKSFKVVLYLLSKGIETFLSTKCEVTEGILSFLVDHGFSEKTVNGHHTLQISIDSVNPSKADLLSGAHNFLKRCERSVANCIHFGISPKLKTVLTSLNYNEIEDIIKYFAKQGVKDFHFVQYGISHFKYREDLYLNNDQKYKIHDISQRINAHFTDMAIVIQDELPQEDINLTDKKQAWSKRARCTGGYSSMVITPVGDVIPCEQMPQEPPYILSNVKNKSIKTIWDNPKFNTFLFPDRSKFKGTVCEQCDDFDKCHLEAGFCYRDSFLAYETVFEAPPNCPKQIRQGRRLI